MLKFSYNVFLVLFSIGKCTALEPGLRQFPANTEYAQSHIQIFNDGELELFIYYVRHFVYDQNIIEHTDVHYNISIPPYTNSSKYPIYIKKGRVKSDFFSPIEYEIDESCPLHTWQLKAQSQFRAEYLLVTQDDIMTVWCRLKNADIDGTTQIIIDTLMRIIVIIPPVSMRVAARLRRWRQNDTKGLHFTPFPTKPQDIRLKLPYDWNGTW